MLKKFKRYYLCFATVAAFFCGMRAQAAEVAKPAADKLPDIQLEAPKPANAISSDTVIMKINGEAIKEGQFDEFLSGMLARQFGGQIGLGSLPPEMMEGLRGQAIEPFKEQILVGQALKQLKASPSDGDIKSEMERIDQLIKADSTTESLATKLAEAKKEDPQIEDKLKSQIKQQLSIIALVEQECKVKIDPTVDQVKAIYDKDPHQWGKVHAAHILIKTAPPQGTAAVSDKDAQATATQVLKEVTAGKDFAELAKKYSQDPGSAPQGGDLGYFGFETMVPEFATAAFKLKKGEVSGLIKSDFGFHIIKSLDYKPATLDDVKARIFMNERSTNMKKYSQTMVKQLSDKAKFEDLMPKKAPTAPPAGMPGMPGAAPAPAPAATPAPAAK